MILIWLFIALLGLALYLRLQTRVTYPSNAVGFLHASSGAGGGGERVMWVALSAIQQFDATRGVDRVYVVFTNRYGDNGTDAELLTLVQQQFGVELKRPVKFVYLRRSLTRWLDGNRYPRATLALQTLFGGSLLFVESSVFNAMTPIVLETVGVPMVYPLLRVLAGSKTISYTHYPIVSSVMTQRALRSQDNANRPPSGKGLIFRYAKAAYYVMFALFYRVLGQFPHCVLTNSSWTQGHMARLYWPRTCSVLFPPCGVHLLSDGAKPASERNNDIVSVGQFRPEKNHMLQLESFAKASFLLPSNSHLVMMGGVRNADDAERVRQLQEAIVSLKLEDRVKIKTNCDFSDIQCTLQNCCVGLHTMKDEHFGIVLLEYMAAGCVALGNNSGGVKLDIINGASYGFLASTAEEYARALVTIVDMKNSLPDDYTAMQRACAEKVKQFSDEHFSRGLLDHIQGYL